MKDKHFKKIVAQNKKARHDYTIEQTLEAGIVLIGQEVKSARLGKANIVDSHAEPSGNEVILHNVDIAPYEKATSFSSYNSRRPRKLLLHKREIRKLIGKFKEKGYTLVALSLYFNHKNKLKVELGIARGKKQHDKRETIKERDWQRQKERQLKNL